MELWARSACTRNLGEAGDSLIRNQILVHSNAALILLVGLLSYFQSAALPTPPSTS